jgi:hypothetical protein
MARSLALNFDPDPYWRIVEDCLVELHGLKRPEAKLRIADLQHRLDNLPPKINPAIFYNAEEFEVAGDLAGQRLDPEQYRDAYERIMSRYYPDVALYLERARSAVERVAVDAWTPGAAEPANQEPRASQRPA